MTFGGAIGYLFSSIGKIPMIFSGLGYFIGGGFGRSMTRMSDTTSHVDMTQTGNQFNDACSVAFWSNTLMNVILLIVSCLKAGILGILGFILGSVGQIILIAASILLYALAMFLGEKFKSHWNTTFIKVVTVLYWIAMVFSLFTLIGGVRNVIGAVIGVKVFDILHSVLSLFQTLILYLSYGLLLDAFAAGTPVNYMGQNDQYGQYGDQTYYNQQGQYGQQNQYGQQGSFNQQGQQNWNNTGAGVAGAAGLGGLGAINDKTTGSIGADSGPIGGSQYNQNNQNNQNVQMYACPFCGGAVTHGTNPCPHCNRFLNW